jgi:GNAT superfamily N-acetyltransferase
MDTLKLIRLDRRRLGDFERLLAGKEFNGCFCSRWAGLPDWSERCLKRPKENFEHTRSRVFSGEQAGFLALREMDGAVVAWTGAGPKTAFPGLKDRPGSRLGPWEDGTWVVACLSVAFAYRGLGYSGRIVELLVEEARRAGAKTLESYPIEPSPEGDAYRGGRRFYEGLGFSLADSETEGATQCMRMVRQL